MLFFQKRNCGGITVELSFSCAGNHRGSGCGWGRNAFSAWFRRGFGRTWQWRPRCSSRHRGRSPGRTGCTPWGRGNSEIFHRYSQFGRSIAASIPNASVSLQADKAEDDTGAAVDIIDEAWCYIYILGRKRFPVLLPGRDRCGWCTRRHWFAARRGGHAVYAYYATVNATLFVPVKSNKQNHQNQPESTKSCPFRKLCLKKKLQQRPTYLENFSQSLWGNVSSGNATTSSHGLL